MTPACPLATVLYRFDDAARFPVFESLTTARGPVTVQADRDESGDFIRIVYHRHETDPDEVFIVLALPLIAIEGRPRQLLLDVSGDARECHLSLEGMDGRGELLSVRFGPLDFTGWRILRADASKLVPPVQFHRLRADIAAAYAAPAPIRWGIRSLSLTGTVRVAATGLSPYGL